MAGDRILGRKRPISFVKSRDPRKLLERVCVTQVASARAALIYHREMDYLKYALLGVFALFGCRTNILSSDAPTDLKPTDLKPPVDLRPAPSRTPLVHRPSAVACPTTRGPGTCQSTPLGGGMCKADSECTTGRNPRCSGNAHDGCNCYSDACVVDGDCDAGKLCDCRVAWREGGDPPNRCLPGNCRVDADCGAKGFCSPSFGGCGAYEGVTGWFCHTADDDCTNDDECQQLDGGFGPPYCGYRPEIGHWTCAVTQCAG